VDLAFEFSKIDQNEANEGNHHKSLLGNLIIKNAGNIV
jgi:hypothetical protein